MPIAIGCCDRREVFLTAKLLRQTFGARLRCPNRRRRHRTVINLTLPSLRRVSGRHLIRREVRLPHWQLLIPDWLWISLSDAYHWPLCPTEFNFVWLTGPEVEQGILEATTTCSCGEIDGRWVLVAEIAHDFSRIIGDPEVVERKVRTTRGENPGEVELKAFLTAVS